MHDHNNRTKWCGLAFGKMCFPWMKNLMEDFLIMACLSCLVSSRCQNELMESLSLLHQCPWLWIKEDVMSIHWMSHQESIVSHEHISMLLYPFLGWKYRLWDIHVTVYVLHNWKLHFESVVYSVRSADWANCVDFTQDEWSHQLWYIEKTIQGAPIVWEEFTLNVPIAPRNPGIHAIVCIVLNHLQNFWLNSCNTGSYMMNE